MGKDRGVSYPLGCYMYICIYGWSNEGGENDDGKEGRELTLSGLLYADGLVLCGRSEEDLRTMVRCFVGV